jgi:hypothetical protein
MQKGFLSIPFSRELTHEKQWDRLDDAQTSFFIVRFHFYCESRQIQEPHKVGSKLAVYEFPEGASQEQVIDEEFELEEINVTSSLKNFLIESEVLNKQVDSLAFAAKVSDLEVRSEVGRELERRMKKSLSESSRIDETSRVRRKVRKQAKSVLGPSVKGAVVAVPVFQKYAIDVQLAWVDYLVVTYEKSWWGLRKKKKSLPEVIDARNHPNRIRCKIPLMTLHYWKLLHASCKLMHEIDHTTEVEDAAEIQFHEYSTNRVRTVRFPRIATLYQIARVAFPNRWVKRRGDWTEEELMKLELDEAVGTGWWYKHGPGRSD